MREQKIASQFKKDAMQGLLKPESLKLAQVKKGIVPKLSREPLPILLLTFDFHEEV